MKVIMWTRVDGGLSITLPSYNDKKEASSVESAIARLPAGATGIKVIEQSDVPTNRYFRGAWADLTPDLDVNIDRAKAEAIKLDNIRKERNKKLETLDLDTMKAVGGSDNALLQATETKKQALRDLPSAVDLSVTALPTFDELENFQPVELA